MKTNIYKSWRHALSFALGVAFSGTSLHATAQLVNCNAFIQGRYVEVGVNHNGAYGSSACAPSGYHPNVTQPGLHNGPSCSDCSGGKNLGFVADPAKDGWTVAGLGAPNYMGDYFVPGSPFEGWSIKADMGAQANFWNGISGASAAVGTNVRYLSSGSRRATEWEGIYDSLLIIQRTILDTANTYFTIRVKIKNLAHKKRRNIYYFRSIDPDNDQPWPMGGFSTDNKISFQNPNSSDLAVVSAWGRGYDTSVTYLGMGTKDSRAKAFLNLRWPASVGIDSIYNGLTDTSYFFDSLTTLNNHDLAIGLVFKIDSLPAFDSTLLKIAYMFGGPKEIGSATDDEGLLPEEEPTKVNPFGLAGGTIRTSPNPFRNLLQVSGLAESDKIRLFTMQGKEIIMDWGGQQTERTMNASGLAPGFYIIRVESADGALKFRQTLQHN